MIRVKTEILVIAAGLLGYLVMPPVGIGAVGKWEEAPVAAEYWRQIYYDREKKICCTTYKTRKTILKPEGIADVSQLGFTYGQQDRVRVIRAMVIQPGGKRIILKNKQMDTRLVASSEHGFSQDKHLSFLFPELTVGSTVELIFERFESGIRAGKGRDFTFSLKKEQIHSQYEEYIANHPWIWQSMGMEDFDIQLSADKKTLVVQPKKPRCPYFVNELNNSYIRFHRLPRIVMNTIEDLQAGFDSEILGWNKVLQAPLPKPMVEAVRQVADKPPEERVMGLLRYIRDNYRYLRDWRPVERGWLPFSLPEIATRGYGDCKDLSAMLVAMLRASGIEAMPALVQRGVCAAPILLPSVTSPNHAIVQAKIGECTWWLDPTNPAFLPGYIMPDIHDRWALILGSDHQMTLSQIPREASHLPEMKVDQVYHHDVDGNAHIDFSMLYSRLVAIGYTTLDYCHGVDVINREVICKGDIKHCQVKREKTDFLVPSSYCIQGNTYEKAAAPPLPMSAGKLSVDWRSLTSLASILRDYIDNQGQGDLYLVNHPSSAVRKVLKNCRLTKAIKSHYITSPWLDYELKWYNAPKEQGCVLEFRAIRKVDWLDHSVLISPEFNAVLEKIEAMVKDLTQVVQYVGQKNSAKK